MSPKEKDGFKRKGVFQLPTNIFEGLWMFMVIFGGVSGGKAVENTIAKPLSDSVVSKTGLIGGFGGFMH